MSQTAHQFDPTILREYDIRGIVGKTLHAADARAIGRAFGTMVRPHGGKRVALGLRRPAELARAGRGADRGPARGRHRRARSIGLGPTPMLYFAVYHLDADGGIQITGSHNPPDYNGFKMMLGKKSFYGADIQELGAIAAKGDCRERRRAGREEADVLDDYVARLLQRRQARHASSRSPGTPATARSACRSAPSSTSCPGEHFVLNEKVDGTFPKHHPDPTVPENLEQLHGRGEAATAASSASPSTATATASARSTARAASSGATSSWILWARDVLKTHPGATIIADVKASQVLFDEIAARRRQAADVEDRPFADQGQDGRDRRAARRRDERPHLLRRHASTASTTRSIAALRLLNIVADGQGKPGRDARWPAAAGQHAGAALRLPGGAQVRRRRGGQGAAAAGRRQGQRHRRRARQHARTAGGCCAPPTPRPVLVARCEARRRGGPRAAQGRPQGGAVGKRRQPAGRGVAGHH